MSTNHETTGHILWPYDKFQDRTCDDCGQYATHLNETLEGSWVCERCKRCYLCNSCGCLSQDCKDYEMRNSETDEYKRVLLCPDCAPYYGE